MKQVSSISKQPAGAKAEGGQAIILIALFMVVMLAMVGLAIDGGGLFLLWRDAQNAADTAALQAAYDRCTSSGATWQTIGYRAADVNGFDNSGIDNTVVVESVDISGTDYTKVTIDAQNPSYFIQLVYSGPLEVTAEALVYCSGAVDFSDLPGMVALGGCECGGAADSRLDFSGARFDLVGSVHSNCDIDINPGGGSNTSSITGDVDASGDGGTGDIDTHGKITLDPGQADTDADLLEMPGEIPIELYMDGGEIYEAIEAVWPTRVHHITGPKVFSEDPLEGLWFIDGDATIPSSWGGDFGEPGFTVVATGQIVYQKTARGTENDWWYYGHNVDDPTGSGDPGVTVDWSRGTGSAILMYSSQDDRPACSGGSSTTAIQILGAGEDENYFDLVGLIYAPYSLVSFSGSSIRIKGPVIGYGIDLSGSQLYWLPEPSFLQPMAPVMNNVE